ncbi:hypothetical protein Tco_1247703 [Tanacetum coccineum]
MAESSSRNPSSPKITPKEEPVTLDKPKSSNPFLPADQIEFTFEEIAFTTNNEVALLYPSHPNSEYFRVVSDFISKFCLKEAFIRAPTQYKEYLCEFCDSIPLQQDQTKYVGDGLKTANTNLGINEESIADEISKKIKLEDLSDLLKDTTSAFFTPDCPQDKPIIVSDESEEEEEVNKDKDTHATSHDKDELEQQKEKAEAEVASLKARPSYPDINQLIDPLVVELKNIQWELPTEFQALPSQVSSVQEKLKTLDSLPNLFNKVTDTLNRFATVVENASGATTKDVPLACQANTSPVEEEKNTNPATTDAKPNLHDELVDLLATGNEYITKDKNKAKQTKPSTGMKRA